MTWLQRLHYIWVRAGLVVLVVAPLAMYLVFRAQGFPDDSFTTTSEIRVTETDAFVRFDPAASRDARWMLLPGCPADPHAYGPLARAVASRGYVSVIVKVPYRCAPWPQHSAQLRQRVRDIAGSCTSCPWALAGHSRGVRHALEIVRALPREEIAALLLIGSTHPRDDDYSDLSMPVMKIMASEDGVAPLDTALGHRALLPASTRFEVIEGGNHAQFGYYGFQLFDHRARISREEQHARTAELVISMLETQ
jgi:pimeloyl-ACP methyl ester carboxylesterase